MSDRHILYIWFQCLVLSCLISVSVMFGTTSFSVLCHVHTYLRLTVCNGDTGCIGCTCFENPLTAFVQESDFQDAKGVLTMWFLTVAVWHSVLRLDTISVREDNVVGPIQKVQNFNLNLDLNFKFFRFVRLVWQVSIIELHKINKRQASMKK